MITDASIYLFTLAAMATFFYLLEQKTNLKLFQYVPVVVLLYATSMLMASLGVFAQNEALKSVYTLAKSNLLPAMLFLMLLEIDFKLFFKLGKKLLYAYILAVISIALSFVVVVKFFDFPHDIATSFAALAGSWLGGTANMVAVGTALGVKEEFFAYALVVDSVDYTLWVMLLLFLVPFASYFNRFSKAESDVATLGTIGCACNVGAKRYWSLILLASGVSFFVQFLAEYVVILSKTTTVVLLSTFLGVVASFTPLRRLGGASEIATSMLYMLIALIGSHAVIESFSGLGIYVLAGLMILLLHGVIMVIGARVLHLDLFSIAVASLSNIGGVASAPILAATYNKKLVGVGVVMAIMGYLIGTFGGLLVGYIILEMQ